MKNQSTVERVLFDLSFSIKYFHDSLHLDKRVHTKWTVLGNTMDTSWTTSSVPLRTEIPTSFLDTPFLGGDFRNSGMGELGASLIFPIKGKEGGKFFLCERDVLSVG